MYVSSACVGSYTTRSHLQASNTRWLDFLLPRNHRSVSGCVLVGRFIVGVAVSVSAVADVSYLAEVAPKAFRGGMVSMNELAISIGMLTSFLTGYILREMHGKQLNILYGSASIMPRPSLSRKRVCICCLLGLYLALHILCCDVYRMQRLRWLTRCVTARRRVLVYVMTYIRCLTPFPGGWRFMFGVSALLAAAQLGLMLAFMPKSPRWLMTQNRHAEARGVLLKIRNSQVRILCFT